jgi:hypothetical protein
VKSVQLLCLVITSLLTSCAAVRNASVSDEVAGQGFSTQPDTASLFLTRDDKGLTASGSIQIFISLGDRFEATKRAEEVVKIMPQSFTRVQIPEGRHELICIFHTKSGGFVRLSSMPIQVEKGRLYFVSVHTEYGFRQRTDDDVTKQDVILRQPVTPELLDGRGSILLMQPPTFVHQPNLRSSCQRWILHDIQGHERVLYLQTIP